MMPNFPKTSKRGKTQQKVFKKDAKLNGVGEGAQKHCRALGIFFDVTNIG